MVDSIESKNVHYCVTHVRTYTRINTSQKKSGALKKTRPEAGIIGDLLLNLHMSPLSSRKCEFDRKFYRKETRIIMEISTESRFQLFSGGAYNFLPPFGDLLSPFFLVCFFGRHFRRPGELRKRFVTFLDLFYLHFCSKIMQNHSRTAPRSPTSFRHRFFRIPDRFPTCANIGFRAGAYRITPPARNRRFCAGPNSVRIFHEKTSFFHPKNH